jgi:hypothetical protein
MKNTQSEKYIKAIRSQYKELDDLENKAFEYHKIGVPHDLNGLVLNELERLHHKLTWILYLLYLGDINRDFNDGKISLEEKEKLYKCKRGRCKSDCEESHFCFGYMTRDFILNLLKG